MHAFLGVGDSAYFMYVQTHMLLLEEGMCPVILATDVIGSHSLGTWQHGRQIQGTLNAKVSGPVLSECKISIIAPHARRDAGPSNTKSVSEALDSPDSAIKSILYPVNSPPLPFSPLPATLSPPHPPYLWLGGRWFEHTPPPLNIVRLIS